MNPSVLTMLNTYTGDDLWNDVIYHLDGYDPQATSDMDPAYQGEVVVVAGNTYRYKENTREWYQA